MVRKGIAAHGVPQRLLSDNGAALNPSRRGVLGQLVAYLRSLGVEPITGKPYKPTTQGKNERFHQTLFRYLDKQPIAATLAELQTQVDMFDQIYNQERPHQGLPGRVTPQAAWDATPVASPPRPVEPHRPLPTREDEIRVRKVGENGVVEFRKIRFGAGRAFAGQRVCVMDSGASVMIFDLHGTLIIEHPWPAAGTRYVSNGRRRGPSSTALRLSPMS